MSEYDLLNTKKILEGHGYWFGALLLRAIALGSDEDREVLSKEWPQEVKAVNENSPSGEGGGLFTTALLRLCLKADSANRNKLLLCSLHEANKQ